MALGKMPRSFPVLALLLAVCAAGPALPAQSLQPEAMPDPNIAGFRYPEAEVTLTRWIMEMTRGTSEEIRAEAAARIHLHGWGLWTALTSESSQAYAGQRLRILETWLTTDEIGEAPATSFASMRLGASARSPRARTALQPLRQLQRPEAELERSA